MRSDPIRRRLTLRRLAAAGAAVLVACSADPAPPDGPPETEPSWRVLLIGDSITAGKVSEPEGPPYAELVAERLAPDAEVVNLGCGGSSTLDWTLSRGERMCAGQVTLPNIYTHRVRPALPADFVTVLLGTNDALGIQERGWISPEDYEAALRELVSHLLEDGAGEVMLLGPPLVIHKVRPMLRVVKYGEALQRICAEVERVVCGPDVRYLLQAPDFAIGNIHPNAAGHAKIANALVPALLARQSAAARSSDEAAASSPSG